MSKLLVNGSLFVAFLVISLELIIRITGLASDVMDRTLTPEKMLVFEPGSEGYRTRGMRAEVKARYRINAQGWNSTQDYDVVRDGAIAIVGDSYIAGFWNDVDSTVASLLELRIKNNFSVDQIPQVHSYGHPGANMRDYEILIPYLKSLGYGRIYIYVASKDFKSKKTTFTNVKEYSGRQGLQYWYPKSALLRYLNVNLGIKDLFNGMRPGNKSIRKNSDLTEKDIDLVKIIETCIKTYSNNDIRFFSDDVFFETQSFEIIRVIHNTKPYDHGFNGHWNVNGNRNAADAIFLDLTNKF